MKPASVHITLGRLLSMALGWVFLAAAIGKGVRPVATLDAIRYLSNNILADSIDVSGAMLVVVILLEIGLASMLLSGWRSVVALWISVILLAPALVWTVYVAASGAPVSCGCGLPEMGVFGIDPDWVAVIRTGGLLVIALILLLLMSFWPSVEGALLFFDRRFTFFQRSIGL